MTAPTPPEPFPATTEINVASVNSAANVLREYIARESPDMVPLLFNADYEGMAMALDAAGRLLPPDTDTRTEWGVWWHASDDDDAICLSADRLGSRAAADQLGRERIGEYGITRYTLRRCEHRRFADGSTLVGPWLPVPTTGETP